MKKYNINKIRGIDYFIPIIFSIVVATIFLLPYLITQVGISGADTVFHFGRFYDTAQQIKNHNFSYFQMNYGMGPNGRIVNAVYGPFFAYLLGGLLLISKSWVQFEIILVYILFLIAGVGMYRLSMKLKISRSVALLVTTLLLLTGYISYWARSTSFQAWGAALMPYVLIQAVDLFNDRNKHFNWIILGVTIAIVAQVHMLGTFLSVLALIPFFIYGVLHTDNKKRMWIDAIKAAFLCALLTANVWGAYLVLYPTNKIATPLGFSASSTAVHLLWVGEISTWVKIQEVVLILFGLQAVYILMNFRKEKINTFFTVEGLIFLFLSSDFFPWAFLEKHFPIIDNYFQFPNRLTIIIFPLLFAGMGLTITKLQNTNGIQIGILAKVLLIFVILSALRADLRENIRRVNDSKGNIVQTQQMRDPDLSKFIIQNNHPDNPDYLPLKNHLQSWVVARLTVSLLNNDNGYTREAIPGGKLRVTWDSDNNQNRVLPIVMYSQSKLSVNGKKTNPKLNEICMPEVPTKRGKNVAILLFETPMIFKVLLIVAIVSWIVVGIIGIKNFIDYLTKNTNLMLDIKGKGQNNASN